MKKHDNDNNDRKFLETVLLLNDAPYLQRSSKFRVIKEHFPLRFENPNSDKTTAHADGHDQEHHDKHEDHNDNDDQDHDNHDNNEQQRQLTTIKGFSWTAC